MSTGNDAVHNDLGEEAVKIDNTAGAGTINQIKAAAEYRDISSCP